MIMCSALAQVNDPMANQNVNQPPHYTSHPSGIECREITRHMNFNLGSAFKYIWRVDLKSAPIEDLEKAMDCIADEIKLRKEQRLTAAKEALGCRQ